MADSDVDICGVRGGKREGVTVEIGVMEAAALREHVVDGDAVGVVVNAGLLERVDVAGCEDVRLRDRVRELVLVNVAEGDVDGVVDEDTDVEAVAEGEAPACGRRSTT